MFDLHTHTTASDGTLTPARIVREAVRLGLSHLSVTDHDTTGGVDEAIETARGSRLQVIPGIELSVEEDETEVHILGYFIDHNHQPLLNHLQKLRIGRESRTGHIIDKLNHYGIPIRLEDVQKHRGGQSMGRPHIAQALVDMGVVKTREEAFLQYLSRGAPCYVAREKLTLEDAISLIINARGIPVLAHPCYGGDLSRLLPRLQKAGIMGIEAYYPAHNPQQTEYYISLARKHNLCITGGTDFHGPGQNGVMQPGLLGVPHRVITDFLEFYRNIFNKELY